MGAGGLDRILLVEDDKDIAALVAMVLGEQAGYTVKVCLSARHALEAVATFRPQLLVLDVMMPEADGLSTLKGLRSLEATRDTPVVFLTAMADAPDIACYQSVGSLGVIAKPFDPLTLAERVEALWRRRPQAAASAFNPRFEELRRAYVAELPGRISSLRAAADAVVTKGWDRPLVEWLFLQAHRLAGSSGIYRMGRLNRAATVLEQCLKRHLAEPWPPVAPPGEIATLVKAVRRVAREEMRGLPERPAEAAARPARAPRAEAVRRR